VSFAAIAAAYHHLSEVDMTPAAKVVLFVLAGRHNQETGRCDPSVMTIGKDARMSDRAVKYALKELATKRVISVTRRKAKTGRGKLNMTNRYVIKPATTCSGANLAPRGANLALTLVQDLHPNLEDRQPTAFDALVGTVEPDIWCHGAWPYDGDGNPIDDTVQNVFRGSSDA